MQNMDPLRLRTTTQEQPIVIQVKPHGFFQLRDVIRDGNCFYSALALSDEIQVRDHAQLRQQLAEAVQGNEAAINLYNKFAKTKVKFTVWLQKVKEPHTWASELEALFICFFLMSIYEL